MKRFSAILRMAITLLVVALTVLSASTASVAMAADKDDIAEAAHLLSWAYYSVPAIDGSVDEDGDSVDWWYISPTQTNSPYYGEVFKLTPVEGGQVGWGRMGTDVATINLSTHTVTIEDGLDINQSHDYYDIGLMKNRTDPNAPLWREAIQNKFLQIDWYFFQVEKTGKWYIVTAPKWGVQLQRLDPPTTNYNWTVINVAGFSRYWAIEYGNLYFTTAFSISQELTTGLKTVKHKSVYDPAYSELKPVGASTDIYHKTTIVTEGSGVGTLEIQLDQPSTVTNTDCNITQGTNAESLPKWTTDVRLLLDLAVGEIQCNHYRDGDKSKNAKHRFEDEREILTSYYGTLIFTGTAFRIIALEDRLRVAAYQHTVTFEFFPGVTDDDRVAIIEEGQELFLVFEGNLRRWHLLPAALNEEDSEQFAGLGVFVEPDTVPPTFAEPAGLTGAFWDVEAKVVEARREGYVMVVFSEPIDPYSVDAGDFIVDSNRPLDALWFGEFPEAVFMRLREPVSPSSSARVEVVGEILDVAGNEMIRDEAELIPGASIPPTIPPRSGFEFPSQPGGGLDIELTPIRGSGETGTVRP